MNVVIKKTSFCYLKNYFLNNIIFNGKKISAEIFYHELLFKLKLKNKNFYNFDMLYYSLITLRPLLNLRSIKRGSSSFKVPVNISDNRRKLFSIKILLKNSVKFNKKLNLTELADNIYLIFVGLKNPVIQKKINLYKDAVDNKIFLKYLK